MIDADRAYTRGITGAGVTVAMIDTGVASQRAGGLGSLSSKSIDLLPDRKPPPTVDPHGGQVASVIAAPLDGNGTVGVAYRSTILSIRADIDGSCARQCAVRGRDLARGIDYALEALADHEEAGGGHHQRHQRGCDARAVGPQVSPQQGELAQLVHAAGGRRFLPHGTRDSRGPLPRRPQGGNAMDNRRRKATEGWRDKEDMAGRRQ